MVDVIKKDIDIAFRLDIKFKSSIDAKKTLVYEFEKLVLLALALICILFLVKTAGYLFWLIKVVRASEMIELHCGCLQ